MSHSADVIVVGAGLSGLQTAVSIHKAGYSVIVLEAKDRVGGRTLTVDASKRGGKLDMGAAWLNDTSQTKIYALAKKYGFDLVQQRAEGVSVFQPQDGPISTHPYGQLPGIDNEEDMAKVNEFIQHFDKLVNDSNLESPHLGIGAEELDNITVKGYLEKIAADPLLVDTVNLLCRALLGADSEEMSLLFLINYVKSGTGLHNISSDLKDGGQYLRNRQGNQTFSERLAAELPAGTTRLSTPVTRVTTQKGGVKVDTPDRGSFSARKIVVTIPTTLYSTIEFSPPLHENKQTLGNSTALGYWSKTTFVFSRPWWREAGLSGVFSSFRGPASAGRDTSVEADGQYSITTVLVGDTGRRWSKFPAAERRRQVTAQLKAIYGAALKEVGREDIQIPEPVNVIEKEWTKDAWTWGGSSPVTWPGVLTSDAGKEMRDPVGNVYFAGAELAVEWKGYMEGALRSGEVTAAEVVKSLRG
ncbi:amine oxidase [Xylariaceae sp. FL0662B]|nr:amine oxidase [Xylariaceae sp. FL0662B]